MGVDACCLIGIQLCFGEGYWSFAAADEERGSWSRKCSPTWDEMVPVEESWG